MTEETLQPKQSLGGDGQAVLGRASTIEEGAEIPDNVHDGFVVVDAEFRLLRQGAGGRIDWLQNYSGKTIWDVFPPGFRSVAQIRFDDVARDGQHRTFEYYCPSQGRSFHVAVYRTRERGFAAYFHDVSAWQQRAI